VKRATLLDAILLILGLVSIMFGVYILWFWHPNPCDGYQICGGLNTTPIRDFWGSAFITGGLILVVVAVIRFFRRHQHQRRNREDSQHP